MYANYGFIPYGQSINGLVFSSKDNRQGCTSEGLLNKNLNTYNIDDAGDKVIVMVERGGCSFA